MVEPQEWNILRCMLPSQEQVLGSDSHNLSCCGLEAPSASLAPSPTHGLLPSFRKGPSYASGTFLASALAPWCGERPPSPCKGEHKVWVSGHATMSLLRCNDVPSQTVTPWRGSNSGLFPTSFSVFSVIITLLWKARVVLCLQ